jgi:hypothetical protein
MAESGMVNEAGAFVVEAAMALKRPLTSEPAKKPDGVAAGPGPVVLRGLEEGFDAPGAGEAALA